MAALEQLRTRLRTRHYSYRTECTYVDWVRRFLDYAAKQQGAPEPRVAPEVVRDYLAHLAVRQQVSASTQNQAFCAILFLDDLHPRGQGTPHPGAKPTRYPPQTHGFVTEASSCPAAQHRNTSTSASEWYDFPRK